jgi:hypothetical protein
LSDDDGLIPGCLRSSEASCIPELLKAAVTVLILRLSLSEAQDDNAQFASPGMARLAFTIRLF